MIGIDVTSIARIEALLQRRPRFATRLFSERERMRCGSKAERFASRFAAKEAVRKLYGGAALPLPHYSAIEVVNRRGGAPMVAVNGELTQLSISLTHDAGVAIAVVSGDPQSTICRDALLQLPPRPGDAHKGKFGTVVVVGGSVGFSGAPMMAALGALRGGAGMARILVPEPIYNAVAAHCLEVMPSPLPARDGEVDSGAMDVVRRRHGAAADVWVLGPGLGAGPGARDFCLTFLHALDRPAVVDADALTIAGEDFPWHEVKADLVLTPHPGEMARICGKPVAEIQSDRGRIAREFATAHGVTLVLKGAGCVVAAADGRLWTSPDAVVALASGGSGDVYAGLLAAMLAQREEPFAAAVAAVTIQTHAAKVLQARMGRAGVLASDVLAELPAAQERIRRALESAR